MLCAIFPNVPVVALTATASKTDVSGIKESFNLRNPLEVIGNPNRPNIHNKKGFRKGEDKDFFEQLLQPIACDLEAKTVNYLTTMYLPLRWCGFAFKFFDIWEVSSTTLLMPSHYQKTDFLPSITPPRQVP